MLAPHRARHMAVLKFSTSSSHRQYSHILKSYHDLFELNVIDPARHTRSLGSGPASRRAAARQRDASDTTGPPETPDQHRTIYNAMADARTRIRCMCIV